jgi:hypothetical protein
MDPVFTLQWTEYLAAQALQRHFPKSKDYSVLVPASRQEKGIDLALVRKRENGASRVALIQVKASRTYVPDPPKRESTVRYRNYTWFNRFDPSPHADFFLLVGLYAPEHGRTKPVNKEWYQACMLLFAYGEMKEFMTNCLKVAGGDDRQFGFGFDTEDCIVQTRGDQQRRQKEFTEHLLRKRTQLIEKHLDGQA